MSQKRQYKRGQIIDDDAESRLLSSVIELAFEPNSKGWKVDKENSSIQTKPHPTTNRSIYRAIAKNQSTLTMEQMYQNYEAGYFKKDDVIYYIDKDHDIRYSKAPPYGPFSGRDCQWIHTRFKILKHISLTGIEYNITGLMEYDVPPTHPLYIKSPEKYYRGKCECDASIYYKRVDASHTDFVFVRIRFTHRAGGWMPNLVENIANYSFIKDAIGDFHDLCSNIPQILQERKGAENTIIKEKAVLFQDEVNMNDEENEGWIYVYQRLLEMEFEDGAAMKAAKLFPNDLNGASCYLFDKQSNNDEQKNVADTASSNDKKIEIKDVNDEKKNNDIIHHPHVIDTKKESINSNTPKKEIVDEHPNIMDTNTGNRTIYQQLMEMGFNEKQSAKAAKLAANDINEAVNIAANYIEYETKRADDNDSVENEKKEELSARDSEKKIFLNFLKRLNMEEFYEEFEKNKCCNMESIEYFEDEFLLNDIGINNKISRKRFLSRCNKMKNAMNKFKNEYGINDVLYDRLAKYGIVTINILCDSVKTKIDLKCKYKIINNNQSQILWNIIQKYENQNDIQMEGN